MRFLLQGLWNLCSLSALSLSDVNVHLPLLCSCRCIIFLVRDNALWAELDPWSVNKQGTWAWRSVKSPLLHVLACPRDHRALLMSQLYFSQSLDLNNLFFWDPAVREDWRWVRFEWRIEIINPPGSAACPGLWMFKPSLPHPSNQTGLKNVNSKEIWFHP